MRQRSEQSLEKVVDLFCRYFDKAGLIMKRLGPLENSL